MTETTYNKYLLSGRDFLPHNKTYCSLLEFRVAKIAFRATFYVVLGAFDTLEVNRLWRLQARLPRKTL